jgi:hypothetical protein
MKHLSSGFFGALACATLLASSAASAQQAAFGALSVPGEKGEDPLVLESLDVDVQIVGRIARTEVKHIFKSHLERVSEGTFVFTLPAGASISRLAMDVEGKMMEGELVERDKARRVYESIVRAEKDPALLEWQGGERFKTQIFPIPARGKKTVVLAYEQLLPARPGGVDYRYALPALDRAAPTQIKRFAFRLRADGVILDKRATRGLEARQRGRQVEAYFEKDRFTPNGPLVVRFKPGKPGDATTYATERGGERFVLADVVPELPRAAPADARALVLAIDTSAGIGSVELERVREAAAALAAEILPTRPVRVVTGDVIASSCARVGATAGRSAKLDDCLARLDAGGATNLGALLQLATSEARKLRRPASIVLFSDGVASLGELDGDLLLANAVARLQGADVRLHAVAVGHGPAEDWLRALTSAGRGRTVRMTPTTSPASVAETIAHLMRAPMLVDGALQLISGEVEGLAPTGVLHLGRGEPLAITGKLKSAKARVRLSGRVRGRMVRLEWDLEAKAPGDDPLVQRQWARRHIAQLESGKVDRKKVVATSQRYGVMSRYTSFLVLENDEAYKRFSIKRKKAAEQAEAESKKAGNLAKAEGSLQDLVQGRGGKRDAAPGGGAPAPEPEPAMEESKVAEMEADFADADDEMEAPRESRRDSAPPRAKKMAKSKPKPRDPRPQWIAEMKRLEERRFGLGPEERIQLFRLYERLGYAEKSDKYYGSLSKRMSEAEELVVLRLIPKLRRRHMDRYRLLVVALLGRPSVNEVVLEAAYELAIEEGGPRRVVELLSPIRTAASDALDVVRRLKSEGHKDEALLLAQAWSKQGVIQVANALELVLDVRGAKKVFGPAVLERALVDAREARRSDMGNRELIAQQLRLLEALGRRGQLQRVLSEAVEFAPHDHGARSWYAERLVADGKVKEGCAQYAAAVQLNPAERDTFRRMMSLRRTHKREAKTVRSCIVDGVSKLPVQRDISLILTWEDPSADVDLHVHEPGGFETYYSQRESPSGGFLYYDITDGFGPEIYVLGQAPKGKYRLTVVYYSGGRKNVRAKLTVLRNAGSPLEERREYNVVLPKSDSSRQLPLTTLRF